MHLPDSRAAAYAEVEWLAPWSDWSPLAEAVPHAPRQPGVYLLREPDTHTVRYVAMASERAGRGRPQGLYGRLSGYRTGADTITSFGEAALDLALADADWVAHQLDRLRAHGPQRARAWTRDAITRLAPEVSWATCHEAPDARLLESQVLELLRPHGLFNR